MQVEIKLDNLEMIRVIKDGSLEALMKSIEDENKIDIPKSNAIGPIPMPTVKLNEVHHIANRVEQEDCEVKPNEKEYRLDEVRAMFAAKNKPAQRSKLKALLKKYNATNISSIDPKDYAAIVADLGEL